ncbi:ABC transporter ATP-binding protein [Coprococcus comes]|uniref:ABC transporter ATP-binding protein n=1 Tax=Coprococcus comes TaxID=410072 RepID=A0A3E4GP15_9FIRM|nr:ABC transporter ATP-binding protein/permease [Coprococcus comes]RGJ22641.1 ABC transporter ATP-binding protein [Coprococcus comes]
MTLYNYMAQMIVELIKLASLIITLNKAMACADRVAGVLDIQTSMHYPEASSPAKDASANEVEFDKVSFTYAGAGASSLSNISFSVKKERRSASSAVPAAERPPLSTC